MAGPFAGAAPPPTGPGYWPGGAQRACAVGSLPPRAPAAGMGNGRDQKSNKVIDGVVVERPSLFRVSLFHFSFF